MKAIELKQKEFKPDTVYYWCTGAGYQEMITGTNDSDHTMEMFPDSDVFLHEMGAIKFTGAKLKAVLRELNCRALEISVAASEIKGE